VGIISPTIKTSGLEEASGRLARSVLGNAQGLTNPALSLALIENASDRLFFHGEVSCPRRFRSRLATTRKLRWTRHHRMYLARINHERSVRKQCCGDKSVVLTC